MYAIETDNLTKYYGKNRGIIDINLKVNEGEIFGFIGPNGAGKSTTIRTLLNFIHPTSGSASILGKDCFTSSKEIKYDVGYLPSETNYYDFMTVRELLNYSAKFYGRRFKGRIRKLADFFELDLKRKMFQLSLGNKKKVAVVQSMLHGPALLIMDEPTSSLDPLMQHQLFDLLKEENQKGTTIFFSSHVLSQVQEFCQKVAIIKDGQIIHAGSIEELRENQLKRIKIKFNSPEEASDFDIEGIIETRKNENNLEILYSGQVQDLIDQLAGKDLNNLLIEDPSLEEIFMHYYEKG
ncbi:MAG: ABC transporter ATP-binding protein [Clostridiales bacterium]|nr:ABC transporter ATP-binding protein [Clostridiales bacterium]MCF8023480.1 ABC transporter ATP-binding protein [Clostridiales bacterium]